MHRYLIVVGDAPDTGGAVLPCEGHPVSTIDGHRIALVGGRAFCAVCERVGVIAKAGGPYRGGFCGAEQALEGDVVVCACPVPPLLTAKLQKLALCEDRSGIEGEYVAPVKLAGWYMPDSGEMTASKKVVDGLVTHPPEAKEKDAICPNMTNDAFVESINERRNRSVRLIQRRLHELDNWDEIARARVQTWFGLGDEHTRQYLHSGFTRCLGIMQGITGRNFVRYSTDFGRNVGCVADSQPGIAAGVCKPDSKSRTIAIAELFCYLRKTSSEKDSQLSTLIHEVTHFTDCFDSLDTAGGFTLSLQLARADSSAALKNADNLAGYVVWGELYED